MQLSNNGNRIMTIEGFVARDIIWKEKVEIDGRINMLEELINV